MKELKNLRCQFGISKIVFNFKGLGAKAATSRQNNSDKPQSPNDPKPQDFFYHLKHQTHCRRGMEGVL